jgi:hypothetical protein
VIKYIFEYIWSLIIRVVINISLYEFWYYLGLNLQRTWSVRQINDVNTTGNYCILNLTSCFYLKDPSSAQGYKIHFILFAWRCPLYVELVAKLKIVSTIFVSYLTKWGVKRNSLKCCASYKTFAYASCWSGAFLKPLGRSIFSTLATPSHLGKYFY